METWEWHSQLYGTIQGIVLVILSWKTHVIIYGNNGNNIQ